MGDGLSEQICTQCAEKAVEMYLFKQTCEKTDATLREQLGKSPFVDHFKEPAVQYCLENNAFDINDSSENIVVKPELNLENDDASSIESIAVENSVEIYSYTTDSIIYNNVGLASQECCNVCGKEFDNQEELTKHKKVHIQKPFVCETCGKSFTRDDLLLRHKIIHAIKLEEKHKDESLSTETNKKSRSETNLKDDNCIQCKICNKRFSKASHLTRHTKIHAPVKPYSCQLCNKGFARAEQLMNHMNAHSGIKPHVCKICSKGKNE